MAKEKVNAKKEAEAPILTAEMRREIVRLAAAAGVEQYRKEQERSREGVRDRRIHNTKLLLERYRGLAEHSKSAVYSATQVEADDLDFYTLVDMMKDYNGAREATVPSIMESAAYTRIIVSHIDRMVEYYGNKCKKGRPEEIRRYRILYSTYLAPEEEQKTAQELADEEHVDLSTIYKDLKTATNQLSALIFGFIE